MPLDYEAAAPLRYRINMPNTIPPDDENLQAQGPPFWEGPSFDDLMLLVFSGPMRFDDTDQDDDTEEANSEEEDSDKDADQK